MSESGHTPRVVFAHGKESGPWGHKISYLAELARAEGWAVESLDYQDLNDATARVARLISHAPQGAPLLLVGSSMGGYVSATACARLAPAALFLMAPALYLPGYPGEPTGCPPDIEVVHGWDDDIVPLSSSIAFAERHRARLHVLADDHRLSGSLDTIGALFSAQLERLRR